MNRNKLIQISIILFLLSSCAPIEVSEADRSRIYVISLDQYWPMLEKKALAWHSDAYLIGVYLPISVDSTNRRGSYASAYFFSDTDPETMLNVELTTSGILLLDYIPIKTKANRDVILRKDWTIDSKDALDKLLTDEDVNFLLQRSNFHCSDLSLNRNPRLDTKPVVWRILVSDCFGPLDYEHSEYLDAMSGEYLIEPEN